MLKNIPANMQGYKLLVTEAPQPKVRENDDGVQEVVIDRKTGAQKFVVSLFAKRNTQPGEYAEKGEEIKVTLAADPGEGFAEGAYVQLIDATVTPWQNERNGRFSSGISFQATGLTPAA